MTMTHERQQPMMDGDADAQHYQDHRAATLRNAALAVLFGGLSGVLFAWGSVAPHLDAPVLRTVFVLLWILYTGASLGNLLLARSFRPPDSDTETAPSAEQAETAGPLAEVKRWYVEDADGAEAEAELERRLTVALGDGADTATAEFAPITPDHESWIPLRGVAERTTEERQNGASAHQHRILRDMAEWSRHQGDHTVADRLEAAIDHD